MACAAGVAVCAQTGVVVEERSERRVDGTTGVGVLALR